MARRRGFFAELQYQARSAQCRNWFSWLLPYLVAQSVDARSRRPENPTSKSCGGAAAPRSAGTPRSRRGASTRGRWTDSALEAAGPSKCHPWLLQVNSAWWPPRFDASSPHALG
jgi:hypothetical protein